MADIVNLSAHREQSQGEAWEDYCAATRRAQDTLDVSDALAAGRAWRRFLDLFLSAEQRSLLTAARLPVERVR